jgi:hypothetical protein
MGDSLSCKTKHVIDALLIIPKFQSMRNDNTNNVSNECVSTFSFVPSLSLMVIANAMAP